MDKETLEIARAESAKPSGEVLGERIDAYQRRHSLDHEVREAEAAKEAALSPLERVIRRKVSKDVDAYKKGYQDGISSTGAGLALIVGVLLLIEFWPL